MIRRAPLVVAVAVALLWANAALGADHPMSMGAGVTSCGKWTEDKADNVRRAINGEWVLGYLSAADALYGDNRNLPGATDAYGLYAWMDSECAAHPLESISDAALLLVLTLSRNATKRP
jgi:hypothetical protein